MSRYVIENVKSMRNASSLYVFFGFQVNKGVNWVRVIKIIEYN